jgi:hypothetical protein
MITTYILYKDILISIYIMIKINNVLTVITKHTYLRYRFNNYLLNIIKEYWNKKQKNIRI